MIFWGFDGDTGEKIVMSWKAGSWTSMRFTDSNEEWIQIRIIAGPKKNIAYLVGGTHPKDMIRLQDLNHKGLKRQQPAKHRCMYIYIYNPLGNSPKGLRCPIL